MSKGNTAQLLSREVSDGVIAPKYTESALELLKAKKRGAYLVLQMDPTWEPPAAEQRDVFGIRFEQHRNHTPITPEHFKKRVTKRTDLPDGAVRDLVVASIAARYTQSNSIVLALNGQTIGIGAGQQSRIHCTRLACSKADTWFLRQHPSVLELEFNEGISRAEKNNTVDLFLLDTLSSGDRNQLENALAHPLERLRREEQTEWVGGLTDVSMASDAFLPFRDNLDRAALSGVCYVAHPGGSVRDEDVIEAADEHDMVLAATGLRLFHH